MGEKRDENSRILWDCGSPLYDSYELASFGNLIERNTMILPSTSESSKRFAIRSSKLRPDEDLAVKMEAVSEVGFFSNFVGRNLWKKRNKAADQERNSNDKAKNLRRLLYSFCNSFWSMQKKKLQT